MKFEAEDPSEVTKSGQGGVDRTQGAARAISVCIPSTIVSRTPPHLYALCSSRSLIQASNGPTWTGSKVSQIVRQSEWTLSFIKLTFTFLKKCRLF